jgi:translation initiation factor 1
MDNSRLVYSTDNGRIEQNKTTVTRSINKDGIVRIMRETKGRKGKGVSIISGLDLAPNDLKTLCSTMKKKCGCGGAVKDGLIELQTDNRDKIKQLLEQHKYNVKLAGG